jgi:glycosyltransferase involved in cell wall biosynthesis
MTLRIGLNLLWLAPGVVGGSENYATGLMKRLLDRDDIDITAFVLPEFAAAYPDLAAKLTLVVAPLPDGRHVVRRVGVENGWLPRKIRIANLDLTHHLGGVIPALCRGRAAVTVHDLQYLAYPEYFSAAKRRYLEATQGPSLRRADIVMAISEFTRADILSRFDIDETKVVVVPPAVEIGPASTIAERLAVRESLGLQDDFIIYPAATYPHKNHLTLLRAFARVAAGREITLVLTGATGAGAWGSAISTGSEIESLAIELGIAEKVRLLGFLPRPQLLALYAEATMLAFPSRYEGFGLPVVESMAAGCPVLAADAAALPELVHGGGLLIDPDDIDAWAQQMERVLDDASLRGELITAGRWRIEELLASDPIEPLLAGYRAGIGLSL